MSSASPSNQAGGRSRPRLHPSALREGQFQASVASLERSLKVDNRLLGGVFALAAISVLAGLGLIVWLIIGLVGSGGEIANLPHALLKTAGVIIAGVFADRTFLGMRVLFAAIDNLHEKLRSVERSKLAASAASVTGDPEDIRAIMNSHLKPEPLTEAPDGTPMEVVRNQLARSKSGRDFSSILGDVFRRESRNGKQPPPGTHEESAKPGDTRRTA